MRALKAGDSLDDATLRRVFNIAEAMLKVLSPKIGLREKIIASILSSMEKHCNELAEKLRLDFQLSIQVNNGVRFCVNRKHRWISLIYRTFLLASRRLLYS